jgi:hypothetical protein
MTLIGTAGIRCRPPHGQRGRNDRVPSGIKIIPSVSLSRRLTPSCAQRSFPRPARRDKFNPLHVLVACKAAVRIVPSDGYVPSLDRGDRANVGRVAVETDASAGFEVAGLFGGHCSLSSSNRTPTPLPFLVGKKSPAFSKVRRIVVRLSSRGSRLSISNSATVDRPTPDSFANRRCDHCKSPLAARHCCEFIMDCNAFRYSEFGDF